MTITDPDREIPAGLVTDEFTLRQITVDDAEADYAAVMDSRADLRLWSQSPWPADDFTLDDNRGDIADMATRTANRKAFDYTVLSPDGSTCVGCLYIFPPDVKFLAASTAVPLTDRAFADLNAVVYFWLRTSVTGDGSEARFLETLRAWFRDTWRLSNVGFDVSVVFERQLALFENSDLTPIFELHDPEKSGPDLIFG